MNINNGIVCQIDGKALRDWFAQQDYERDSLMREMAEAKAMRDKEEAKDETL